MWVGPTVPPTRFKGDEHMAIVSRRGFLGVFAAGVASLALGACGSSKGSEGAATTSAAATDTAAVDAAGTGAVGDGTDYSRGTHHATIEVADFGAIKVELYATNAPVTVANFARLANEGFYDGLTFHRIIKGFMIQGGDPKGDGTGGSDETITGEFAKNGHPNPISHTRGTISMARSSSPDSASSQFFIMQGDSTQLDGSYAAFGHVTEGMDVVDAICDAVTPTDDNGTVPADEQPRITSVRMDD